MADNANLETFEQLVAALHKPLVAYISVRISPEAGAEDVAQQVWANAWQDFAKSPQEGGYDSAKGSYYGYLLNRFAKFKIKQYLEKQRKIGANETVSIVIEGRETMAEPGDEGKNNPERLAELEEWLEVKFRAVCEMFRLTFLCGGYPHQQLAFGFSKHIYGSPSPRGIEGNSSRLDSEYGDVIFELLVKQYWQSYKAASQLDGTEELTRLYKYLAPLRQRLNSQVQELMQLDSASLSQYVQLQRSKAASTCLRDYYTGRKGGFTAAIPDWCYKVEKRVRDILAIAKGGSPEQVVEHIMSNLDSGSIEPDQCGHCKLRAVPPCGPESDG